jgi:hypothetical protein
MPYCSRTFSLTTAGLLNSKSVPTLVFGNAMTSRIDCVLQRIVIRRSNPARKVNSGNQSGLWTDRGRFPHEVGPHIAGRAIVVRMGTSLAHSAEGD